MNFKAAILFIKKNGIVLESATGRFPTLTHFLVNEKIKGSWWAHPRAHEIYSILQKVRLSKQILTCRLYKSKITFIHKRLWASLIKLSSKFPKENLCVIQEVHTPLGKHIVKIISLKKWVPIKTLKGVEKLSNNKAMSVLGEGNLKVLLRK